MVNATEARLQARVAALLAEVSLLSQENAAQTYHGNSVGYIHDKMICYRQQVGMAFEALRELGYKEESNDNDQRRTAIRSWTSQVKAENARLRSENAVLSALVEGGELELDRLRGELAEAKRVALRFRAAADALLLAYRLQMSTMKMGSVLDEMSKARRQFDAAMGEGECSECSDPNPTVCPGCGGPTTHDRCYPPNPYYCDACDESRLAKGEGEGDG